MRALLASLAFTLFAASSAPASAQALGDQRLSYWFADANEISPYRLYVPKAWQAQKAWPLVVILHGGDQTSDGPFDQEPEGLKGILAREAETHGFIVVSPQGHRGQYGAAGKPPQPPGQPPTAASLMSPEEWQRTNALSEQDVLNVVGLVSKAFNVDGRRVYLMGNALGEVGTLHLAQKFPQMWRAIAPSGDPRDPANYAFANVKGLKAALFVQGELDKGNRVPDNIARQQSFAEAFSAQGVDARMWVVPGGTRQTARYMALPKIFGFFVEQR